MKTKGKGFSNDRAQNIWIKILEISPKSLDEIDLIIKEQEKQKINEYFIKKRKMRGLCKLKVDHYGEVYESEYIPEVEHTQYKPNPYVTWHLPSSYINYKDQYRKSLRYKKMEADRKRNRYHSDPEFKNRILEGVKKYAKNHPDKIRQKIRRQYERKKNDPVWIGRFRDNVKKWQLLHKDYLRNKAREKYLRRKGCQVIIEDGRIKG